MSHAIAIERGVRVLRRFLAEQTFDVRQADAPTFARWLNEHHSAWQEERVSEEVLQKLAAEQVLPARQVGEQWRFLKSALQHWLGREPVAAERWFDALPRWLELLPKELLLAELERRLVRSIAAAEKQPAERGSKERILALAGAWKDDPTLR